MDFEVKIAKVFNCFSFLVEDVGRLGDRNVNYKVKALKCGGFRLLIKGEFDATNRLRSLATQSSDILPLLSSPSVLHSSIFCHSSRSLHPSSSLCGFVAIRRRIRDLESSQLVKMRH